MDAWRVEEREWEGGVMMIEWGWWIESDHGLNLIRNEHA